MTNATRKRSFLLRRYVLIFLIWWEVKEDLCLTYLKMHKENQDDWECFKIVQNIYCRSLSCSGVQTVVPLICCSSFVAFLPLKLQKKNDPHFPHLLAPNVCRKWEVANVRSLGCLCDTAAVGTDCLTSLVLSVLASQADIRSDPDCDLWTT